MKAESRIKGRVENLSKQVSAREMKRYSDYLRVAFLLLVTFWVYRACLRCFFYRDDFFFAYAVRNFSFIEFLKLPFSEQFLDPSNISWNFRPIPHYVIFSIGHYFFGLNAGAYHIFDLLFHILNTLLVYRLATTVTSSTRAGFITGLLYAMAVRVHFESVFLTSVADIGMIFFTLSSLTLHPLHSEKLKHPRILSLFSVLSYLLALLTKETAIILPGLLFVLLLLRHYPKKKQIKSIILGAIRSLIPYVAITFLYFALRLPRIIQATTGPTYYKLHFAMDLVPKKYLWGVIWSLDVFLQPLQRIEDLIAPDSHLFGLFSGAIFLLGLGATVWLFLRASPDKRRIQTRVILLGSTWFVLGLLPLLPFRAFAAYVFGLPSIGLFIMLGFLFDESFQRLESQQRWYGWGVFVLLVMLLLGSALVGVSSLEETAWPARGARITQATISCIQSKYPTLPEDSRIYLVGFPMDTWHQETVSWAFRLFYDRDDLTVSVESDVGSLTNLGNCNNVFVFAYVENEGELIEEIPCRSLEVNLTSEKG